MQKKDYDVVQASMRKLYDMVTYCENNVDCRRVLTLKYFGEVFDAASCGRGCDNCKGGGDAPAMVSTHAVDVFPFREPNKGLRLRRART